MLLLAAWVFVKNYHWSWKQIRACLGSLQLLGAVLIAGGDLGRGAVQRQFSFSVLWGSVWDRILSGHPFCLPELGSLHYNICRQLSYKQSSLQS